MKEILENLQKIVGGLIEYPYISKILSKNHIDLICNEEGKFIAGLKPEIAIVDKDGYVQDIIMGTGVFASVNRDGQTVGLTEEQANIVRSVFKHNAVLKFNDNMCPVKVIGMDGE